jgi:hypothetical protein
MSNVLRGLKSRFGSFKVRELIRILEIADVFPIYMIYLDFNGIIIINSVIMSLISLIPKITFNKIISNLFNRFKFFI